MTAIPRLNGAIKALENGEPAFVTFSNADLASAQAIAAAPYDGVVFEMEHNPLDIVALRSCLQQMLDRRAIAELGQRCSGRSRRSSAFLRTAAR